MKRWFALLILKKIIILSLFPQQRRKTLSSLPEVGNVTSKCDGITCYRSSHVLGAITIKSYNVSYKPRAITLWSNYDLNKPSTFYGLLKHYAITQRCNVVLSQYCCNGHIDGLSFTHPSAYLLYLRNPHMSPSAACVRKRRREGFTVQSETCTMYNCKKR